MGCPNLPYEYFFSLNRHAHFEKPLSGFFNIAQRDPIGNRVTSTTSETGTPTTRNYTTNSLNQYTTINNPLASPGYDNDGNMTNDGDWAYTWDAENRMISATDGDRTLQFTYDYASRRVEKKVLDGGENETSKERFVYDGFLQIEKLDALDNNTVVNKRIWGTEGRIISDVNSNGAFYAFGDANKNITEYVDASGTIQGHYEFSPFGKVIVASGANPDNFDFRFSSEYSDTETGLVYYNYRYYNPETGRWLSRDPLKEAGSINLYSMLFNNPVNNWDYLGAAGINPGVRQAMQQALNDFMKNYQDALDKCQRNCDKNHACPCQKDQRDQCRKDCVNTAANWAFGQLSSDEQGALAVWAAGVSGSTNWFPSSAGGSIEGAFVTTVGEKWGENYQIFSSGADLYDVRSNELQAGVDIGISGSVNVAWGEGESESWKGDFTTYSLSIGIYSVSYFTDGKNWGGVSLGVGLGPLPFGYSVGRLHYK